MMLQRYTVSQRMWRMAGEAVQTSRWYLAALALLLLGTYVLLRAGAAPPTRSGVTVTVRIPANAGQHEVATILRTHDLIRSRTAFEVLARVGCEGRPFVAGTYRIRKNASLFDVVDQLIQGKVATSRVTIPEGFTISQIAKRLEAGGVTQGAAFAEKAAEGASEFGMETPNGSLEGYLFPDTYFFDLEVEPDTAIRQMLEALKVRVVDPYADTMKRRGQTLHEVLTIASLVEREARTAEDRPLVASVIMNRLAARMPLQIDATVQYAAGRHKNRLLFRDLEVDSPYNTYKHRGLPPGPIASPGLASIKAALNPASTDYLYYVATKDGGHLFASTFEAHKANIRKARGQ